MTQKTKLPEVTLDFLRGTLRILERLRQRKTVPVIADELNVTESAVFKRLGVLKGHFGKAFTELDPERPGFLLPQIEEFAASAAKILSDLDALFNPTRFGLRRVTLVTYPSVNALFVTHRLLPTLINGGGGLPPFRHAFPYHGIELRQVASAEEGVREVEQNLADAAIIDRDGSTPLEAVVGFRREELFPCVERGFLYRKGSPSEAALKGAGKFRLARLSAVTVFHTAGDDWAVKKGYFPDPAPGEGGRVGLATYSQVLDAVNAGLGVGVGFRPKAADRYPEVGFLGFQEILNEADGGNRAVQYLQRRSRFTFDLYAASGWDDGDTPRRLSEAGLALVRAVLRVAEGYTHDYVS